MDRRRFLLTSLAGAFAAPLTAGTQQASSIRRVGLLGPVVYNPTNPLTVVFRKRMSELGYTEGHNIAFEARGGPMEQLPSLAGELLELNLDVIVAWSTPAVAALKQRTTSIPIVMSAGGDPVEQGFVASLSRPGGNVTGVSAASRDIYGKSIELLREVVSGVSRIGILWDSSDPTALHVRRALDGVGNTMKVQLELVDTPDLEEAFDLLRSKRVGAVFVTPQARNYRRQHEIR